MTPPAMPSIPAMPSMGTAKGPSRGLASRQDILAEAMSWQGTPYRHQACCKGVGCDCLGLIRGVYEHFWGHPETPPAYSPDWADANAPDTLKQAADRYLKPVSLSHIQPSDVLLFRYRAGFPAKHAAILVDQNHFLHAQHGSGVALVSFCAWWRRHLAFAFAFPLQ